VPEPSAEEEATLLEHASAALEVTLGPDDAAGRYAGLRPLLAGDGATADLSRRHAVVHDTETGALTVVGGKLTTYRAMAQDAVDRITEAPCRTARLPLVGAAGAAGAGAAGAGAARRAGAAAPSRLVRRFGAEAAAVAELGSTEPLSPGLPVCEAELRWASEHELALTPEDVADRRTRAGLVPEWREAVLAAARATIPGWSSAPSPPPTSTTSPS
jgi:glycerol-3-phosphate dehydrogenase